MANIKTEESLLEDIEQSTRRVYNQSKILDEEAKEHTRLLNGMENGVHDAQVGLESNTTRAYGINQRKGSLTWMYCVITGEVILLIILLISGLT
mmetsp:Transcript_2540/g.3888  ORF Transcript_2540/g.3888 Transcript_2540/m.3888 type:complete len:94 (+) Transcript_2540:60-341(+)